MKNFEEMTEMTRVDRNEAEQYVKNENNPLEWRTKLQDGVNRLDRALVKFPDAKMYVNRIGQIDIWID